MSRVIWKTLGVVKVIGDSVGLRVIEYRVLKLGFCKSEQPRKIAYFNCVAKFDGIVWVGEGDDR